MRHIVSERSSGHTICMYLPAITDIHVDKISQMRKGTGANPSQKCLLKISNRCLPSKQQQKCHRKIVLWPVEGGDLPMYVLPPWIRPCKALVNIKLNHWIAFLSFLEPTLTIWVSVLLQKIAHNCQSLKVSFNRTINFSPTALTTGCFHEPLTAFVLARCHRYR